MGLSLGGVAFTAFEVPSVVTFGGAQSLAVYRLPGGVRVVDAMGPDDADIGWQGILSGDDATDRARALDAMRIAGLPVTLAWDEFFYSVVIGSLQLAFCNSWWIPYKVSCIVVNDPSVQGLPQTVSLLSAVASDLASAADLTNVTAAIAAIATAGSAGSGTTLYSAANIALQSAGSTIARSIQTAEPQMSADQLPSIISAAETLATATAARGYIARAAANYSQVAF
jgi:hypothetical protein